MASFDKLLLDSSGDYLSLDSSSGDELLLELIPLTQLSHTTDAHLQGQKAHTTDMLLYAGVWYTTDALLQSNDNTKTHLTDTLLQKEEALSHSTDALLYTASTTYHTTDALLQKEESPNHSTDAKIVYTYDVGHTTDALLRVELTTYHTTDASLSGVSIHTTDALLQQLVQLGHSTDARVVYVRTILSTTDARLYYLFTAGGPFVFKKFGIIGLATYTPPIPFYPSDNLPDVQATNRQWLQSRAFWGIDGGFGCDKPHKPYRCVVYGDKLLLGELDPINEGRPELLSSSETIQNIEFQKATEAKEKAEKRNLTRQQDPSYVEPTCEKPLPDYLPEYKDIDSLVKDSLMTQVDKFRRKKRRH